MTAVLTFLPNNDRNLVRRSVVSHDSHDTYLNTIIMMIIQNRPGRDAKTEHVRIVDPPNKRTFFFQGSTLFLLTTSRHRGKRTIHSHFIRSVHLIFISSHSFYIMETSSSSSSSTSSFNSILTGLLVTDRLPPFAEYKGQESFFGQVPPLSEGVGTCWKHIYEYT